MIEAKKFDSIISSLENFLEPENSLGRPKNNKGISISDVEAEKFQEYLREPYKNGYWLLQGDWKNSSNYSMELLDQLKLLDGLNNENQSNSLSAVKKIEEKDRFKILRISARLSPIFSIFRRSENDKLGKKNPALSDDDSWIKEIDWERFKDKFPDAFNIYSDKIYTPEIGAGVGNHRFFSFKGGTVAYLHVPRVEKSLRIAATDADTLSALRDFYVALGTIENVSLKRVFPPDDELFSPYFFIVSALLPRILIDKKMAATFGRALDYYETEDYQHCISTLGLICEDYLHRIYTTVLRAPIVGGLTLGQTIDLLHKNIEALFSVARPSLRSLDSLYASIKDVKPDSDVGALKSILIEITSTIKDDRAFYSKKIEDLTKQHSKKTPFPNAINENLNELLKWRNAASHNTRIPLGAHEADRTLYCLISLVMWWEDKVSSLDWTLSNIEILERLMLDARSKV